VNNFSVLWSPVTEKYCFCLTFSTLRLIVLLIIAVKVKVKFTLEQATKAQRGVEV